MVSFRRVVPLVFLFDGLPIGKPPAAGDCTGQNHDCQNDKCCHTPTFLRLPHGSVSFVAVYWQEPFVPAAKVGSDVW